MWAGAALLRRKNKGYDLAMKCTAALCLIAALVATGCAATAPYEGRTKYWERAELMYQMNRPNRTTEIPGAETSDSPWWFY